MQRTIAAAALLMLIGLAAPRTTHADFSLFIGRPGFSLFAGDVPSYPPVVALAPPPVVVERPYYVPVYGPRHKHYWKHWKHWKPGKKHHGWDD